MASRRHRNWRFFVRKRRDSVGCITVRIPRCVVTSTVCLAVRRLMPQFWVRMSASNCCRVLVRFNAQMDLTSTSRNMLSSNARDMSLMDRVAPSMAFQCQSTLHTKEFWKLNKVVLMAVQHQSGSLFATSLESEHVLAERTSCPRGHMVRRRWSCGDAATMQILLCWSVSA